MNIYNLSDHRLAFAAVAIFLLSCAGAGNAQTAQQERSSIRRITIDSEVSQPEIPLIQSPGNFKAFMIGGGVGAAVDQQEAGKAFREYMRRNNIDISKIVLEAFKRTIQEGNILALAPDSLGFETVEVTLRAPLSRAFSRQRSRFRPCDNR